MSGLILPPGSGNGIEIFKPPWERPTPEGTAMVLATLPKELLDSLVKRVADAVLERLNQKPEPYDGPRQDEEDGA